MIQNTNDKSIDKSVCSEKNLSAKIVEAFSKGQSQGGSARTAKARSEGKDQKPVPSTTEVVSEDEADDKLGLAIAQQATEDMKPVDWEATEFPVDVFPEAIARYIRDTARKMSCPEDYLAVPALVIAGAIIGNSRVLKIDNQWFVRSAIWALIVGNPGSMKSPALSRAMLPAHELDRQLREKDKKHRLTATDCTVEKLVDVMLANPNGTLLYLDEAVGWVQGMNQYKGGKGSDKAFYLSAWSGDEFKKDRKSEDDVVLGKPFLSVIGNVPPQMLSEFVDRKNREEGFIDRFLFAFPDPKPVRWCREDVKQEVIESYKCALLGLAEFRTTEEKVYHLSDDAFDVWEAWYNAHHSDNSGPEAAFSKMGGYCGSIALILHCFAAPDEDGISVETLKCAIRAIDYFKNTCRRARGMIETVNEQTVVQRVIGVIVSGRSKGQQITARLLQQAKIVSKAEEGLRVMRELARLGLGEVVRGKRTDSFTFVPNDNLDAAYRQEEPKGRK